MKIASFLLAMAALSASAAVPFKNGTIFLLKNVPGELISKGV